MNKSESGLVFSRLTEKSGIDGLLFFILLVLYLYNMNPNPGFHDSIGFMADSVEGFHWESNATNHLLYNNFLYLLVKGLPFLTPIFVGALLSVLFSLLSLLRLNEMLRMMGFPQTVSLACVAIMGTSFTWWQQTETIEVYAFNCFFFLSFLRYAIQDFISGRREHMVKASVYLGLALLIHIQNILAIPFFLVYIFSGTEINTLKRIGSALLGLSGLALLFVPVAFGLNSASAVFVDRQFGQQATGLNLSNILHGAALSAGFFLYNFHIFIPFLLHGIWVMAKEKRQLFIYLCLVLLPWIGFGIKFNVPDSHVFFISAWFVMMIPLAASFHHWWQRVPSLVSLVLVGALIVTPMLYLVSTKIGESHSSLRTYATEKAYKGGVAHLLWPGKRNAPDPLILAKELCKTGTCPPAEWDINGAVRYLKLIGAWDEPKP